jgi:hypothetical protein
VAPNEAAHPAPAVAVQNVPAESPAEVVKLSQPGPPSGSFALD